MLAPHGYIAASDQSLRGCPERPLARQPRPSDAPDRRDGGRPLAQVHAGQAALLQLPVRAELRLWHGGAGTDRVKGLRLQGHGPGQVRNRVARPGVRAKGGGRALSLGAIVLLRHVAPLRACLDEAQRCAHSGARAVLDAGLGVEAARLAKVLVLVVEVWHEHARRPEQGLRLAPARQDRDRVYRFARPVCLWPQGRARQPVRLAQEHKRELCACPPPGKIAQTPAPCPRLAARRATRASRSLVFVCVVSLFACRGWGPRSASFTTTRGR